jgi:hypothetical protein
MGYKIGMDLNALRSFLVIAEEPHISRKLQYFAYFYAARVQHEERMMDESGVYRAGEVMRHQMTQFHLISAFHFGDHQTRIDESLRISNCPGARQREQRIYP